MSRTIATLFFSCGFLLSAVGLAIGQETINPTGDPKLVPERILALDSGGHTGGVYRLIPNAYGDQLISVSYDKTIRLWDLQTGETIRVLRPPIDRGTLGQIGAASLHPDGDLLAIGGYRALTPIYDHRIRLISLTSGESVRLLKGHTYQVYDVAFSPDGKRLASGALDSTARIWNVETGETEFELKGHTNGVHAVAWSADGKHLMTGSLDGTGRIWNSATGASEAVLDGHRGPIYPADWSPDGRSIVTGCDDAVLRLFEPDGKPRFAWPPRPCTIRSVKFSPDSSRVLCSYSFDGYGSVSQGACVLSMTDGRELARFTGHDNFIQSGNFLRDGKTAVTGDSVGCICLWDAATGQLRRRLQGRGQSKYAVGWSPDGQQIAWGNANDYDSVTYLAPLERTFSFSDLNFGGSPQGNFVQSQSAMGSLRLRVDANKIGQVFRGGGLLNSFKLPDPADEILSWTLLGGDKVAFGGRTNSYIFDVNSGQLKGELADSSPGAQVWSVSPSPDHRYLLTGGADQTMRIWKSDTNELLVSLFVAGDEWVAWTPQGYYAASLSGENLMGWHVNNGLDLMAAYYPAARFRNSLYRPDIIRRLVQLGSLQEAHAQADSAAGRVTKTIVIQAAMPPIVKVAIQQSPESATVEVQGTASPTGEDPVTSMQLLVDGRPARAPQTFAAGEIAKAVERQQSWKVNLPPGEHRVSVRADTDKSYGIGEAEASTKSSGTLSPGKLYALAVGISAYQQPALRLPMATLDSQWIADVFQKRGQPLFSKVETKLVTDAGATRAGLLDGLAWLRDSMTLADTAVIFLAAQADVDSQGVLKLLTVDADATTAKPALSADELKQNLGSIAGKIVLLLDAHPKPILTPAGPQDHVHGPADSLVRNLLADDCGVAVLTSTVRRELPIDLADHGAFTQALLEGLQGTADSNRDGTVQLNELGSFVVGRVPQLTHDRQHATFHRPALVRTFPLVGAAASP